MFDDFLPIRVPDAESLPFHLLELKLVVCVCVCQANFLNLQTLTRF